jgi:hypothetical protein
MIFRIKMIIFPNTAIGLCNKDAEYSVTQEITL